MELFTLTKKTYELKSQVISYGEQNRELFKLKKGLRYSNVKIAVHQGHIFIFKFTRLLFNVLMGRK